MEGRLAIQDGRASVAISLSQTWGAWLMIHQLQMSGVVDTESVVSTVPVIKRGITQRLILS